MFLKETLWMGEVGGAKESLKLEEENINCEGMDQSSDEQSTKQKRKSMVRMDSVKQKTINQKGKI